LILADTSAWIEYLRRTGSPENLRVRGLLDAGELAVTDVVIMEVLAGAFDALHRRRLRRLLGSCEYVPTLAPHDYEAAADLSRTCRHAGLTIRAIADCLVAAVAIRAGAAVLHADRDFDSIAHHAPLKLD